MKRRNHRAPAARGVERVRRQFVGIETIPVHALVVRFTHNSATIFHDEAIIHARVFVRWQGQVIVVQLGDELVAKIFFPVGGLIEGWFIHGFGSHDQNDGNLRAEVFPGLLGVIAFVRGVLREGAGPDAATFEDTQNRENALVGDFRIFGFPDEPAANNPFGAVLFQKRDDRGIGFAFGGRGDVEAEADGERVARPAFARLWRGKRGGTGAVRLIV